MERGSKSLEALFGGPYIWLRDWSRSHLANVISPLRRHWSPLQSVNRELVKNPSILSNEMKRLITVRSLLRLRGCMSECSEEL